MGHPDLDLDMTAQAEALRRGDVSPEEIVDASIEAAERINPRINAIIHPRYEAARKEAARVLDERPDAPFAGVPIAIKDLGCAMAGEPHHQGVGVLKAIGYRAPTGSALYRRLRDAGFIAIGRTNTPELGSTITTESLAYGPARNPWNLERSTGGSSGGSAAAVAARIVAVAHASDGGGSIRIPASECGLVGLKPSRGRVSMAPEIGESWMGSSTDGAVTRTVRDAAAILDVMAGYEPGDPYTAPPFARPLVDEVGADPGRLRIGVLDHPLLGAKGHPECSAAANAAARALESLGHHVDVEWPEAIGEAEFVTNFRTIVATWTAYDIAHIEEIIGRPVVEGDLEPDNLTLAAMGREVAGAGYVAAMIAVHRWCRRVLGWWQDHDVLLTPTIAAPPPPIGYLSEPGKGGRMFELLQYTAQFNVTGQPAISLPLHMTTDGLPVGVQLVAAYGREDLLIRLAAQFEQAMPWADRTPAVHA